jgi:hypothetical protein
MNGELQFEEIFKSLVEECKKIDIEYDYTSRYFKDDSYAEYEIKKINGEYPFVIRSKVLRLGKEGVEKLKEELKYIDYEHRVSYLEEIKEEILYLKSIIQEDKIVYEESEYGPRKEVQFRTFGSANLIPTNQERTNGHKKSILKKASEYAIAWESGIDEIASKVDFLKHQIELLPEPKTAIKDKNTLHVFYSWQSDIDSEKKAIQRSLDKITTHFKKTGKNVKIDSDMRGTTGSLDITSTLFHKINSCDIFVADINIVNQSFYRQGLFSPNANVLIELGFAASKIGWERVILVFNSTEYSIEQLPFDIRQKAILWYKNQPQLEEKLKFAISELLKKEDNSG